MGIANKTLMTQIFMQLLQNKVTLKNKFIDYFSGYKHILIIGGNNICYKLFA